MLRAKGAAFFKEVSFLCFLGVRFGVYEDFHVIEDCEFKLWLS